MSLVISRSIGHDEDIPLVPFPFAAMSPSPLRRVLFNAIGNISFPFCQEAALSFLFCSWLQMFNTIWLLSFSGSRASKGRGKYLRATFQHIFGVAT